MKGFLTGSWNMENEQHHYELRSSSRSRSHTPMILNHLLPEEEATEHHYDLRSRSRERSHTPGEITSSRRSGSRSLTGSSSKTYERNMETIEESKEGSVTESITDNQSTKSESSSVTARRPERRSERQRARRQIFVNGQSESKEDAFDRKAEQERKSVTPHRVLTSDYSSEEGEREDPPKRPGSAYEIYKQAGEWWNVFPKTDYTYSKASQYRYEIAPGILAMPNMSRRSIHANGNDNNRIPQNVEQNLSQASQRTTESGISDTDTIDLKETNSLFRTSEDNYNISHAYTSNSAKMMYKKRTHIEHHMSQKKIIYADTEYSPDRWSRYPYLDTPVTFTERYGLSQNAESDNELNEAFETSRPTTNQRWRIVQWFTYLIRFIILFIVAPFKKILEFFKFKKQITERKAEYYDTMLQSNNEIKQETMLHILDRWSNIIYFLYVRFLVFDAWLLSRLTGVRKNLPERKFPRILWIILPLFFLLGAYIAQKHFFTCMDSLRNVQHGVTETTYHIFNNISELTSLNYELLLKYFTDFKNYSMHLLPSVNVSLPEMPPIGWNIKW